MTCIKPFQGVFPCGQCLACRINTSTMWSKRLKDELMYWNNAVFITLTYDNEHYQKSLSVKEMQTFIKRLRYYSNNDIKYFVCGEYGENGTFRSHYHGIIFGLSPMDSEIIKKAWNKGFIKVGTVTEASIRYVTDYVLKKLNGKMSEDVYQGRHPPFKLGSSGLGKQFIFDNLENLITNDGYFVHGRKVKLPRYYQEKILDYLKLTNIEKAREFYWNHKKDLRRIEAEIDKANILEIKSTVLKGMEDDSYNDTDIAILTRQRLIQNRENVVKNKQDRMNFYRKGVL